MTPVPLAAFSTRGVLETSRRSVVRDAGSDATCPAPLGDAELVAALQRGEPAAARLLYDRVHEPVVRTLSKLLRQRHAAALEDAAQNTFERMIRFLSARSLDVDCNLRGWARVVATNVALDHLRRELTERRLFADEPLELHGTEQAAEAGIDRRAALQRVHGLLARMDPKYAQTLILHDVLGHELSEIAGMMGVSVAAAQSRLVRGRKDLLRRAQKARTP